jgi:hypothetical protein
MDVEIGGHVALDLVEELTELLRAVARHALADNGPGLHVECGKQRRGSVPRIVMGVGECSDCHSQAARVARSNRVQITQDDVLRGLHRDATLTGEGSTAAAHVSAPRRRAMGAR